MKIFLDDIRNIPEDYNYTVVRDYNSCISVLNVFKNELEFVSLDYSLGSDKTGYDILVYMVENNIFPERINIHSDHSVGVPLMKDFIKNNFPKLIVPTFNRVV